MKRLRNFWVALVAFLVHSSLFLAAAYPAPAIPHLTSHRATSVYLYEMNTTRLELQSAPGGVEDTQRVEQARVV